MILKRRYGQNKDDVIHLQEQLVRAGYKLSIDGIFGYETEGAVMQFQKDARLVIDGIVGAKTWKSLIVETEISDAKDLSAKMMNKTLSEDDLLYAADELEVELATIKAVNEVESSGSGFILDRPKILFEGHVFWRRLKAYRIDPTIFVNEGYENVLYESWERKHYLGGLREYERLERAREIHNGAAFESASWGLFQIMGYHWHDLGYKSIYEFAECMHKSEGEHLKAFVRFVIHNNLAGHLQRKNWAAFARGYNGSGYKQNNYDIKLARAYNRYQRITK